MKRNILITGGAVAAVALILAFTVPTHIKVESPFVLQPAQRAEVHAESDGFIRDILVREHQKVTRGQVIARLANPDLSTKKEQAELELQLVNRRLAGLQSTLATSEYQQQLRQEVQLQQTYEELKRKMDQLTLKAPMNGTVLTPMVEERVGTYVKRGDLVCMIGDLEHVKVQMPVAEYDVVDVKPGQEVRLKLDAFPVKTLVGRVSKISSSISERVVGLQQTFARFTVDVLIDNSDGKLIPGMAGDAKIMADQHSVGVRAGRELRRWIKSKIW